MLKLKLNNIFPILFIVFISCSNKTYTYYKYKEPEFNKKSYLYNINKNNGTIKFKNKDNGVITFDDENNKLLLNNYEKKSIIKDFNQKDYLKIKNIKYLTNNDKPDYLYNFKNKKYFNNTKSEWKKEIKFKNYQSIDFKNKKFMDLNEIKKVNKKVENRIEKTNFILNFFNNLKTAVLGIFLTPFENTLEKEYSTKNIYKKQNLNIEKEYFNFK